MTCEYNDKGELIITLGPIAFAEVRTKLSKKKGYRYEMTDTEIKLRCGVIRSTLYRQRSKAVDPRDTGDFYADEMGL